MEAYSEMDKAIKIANKVYSSIILGHEIEKKEFEKAIRCLEYLIMIEESLDRLEIFRTQKLLTEKHLRSLEKKEGK